MELKKECVRNVLLFIEKKLPYGDSIEATSIKLKSYSQNDILYTCNQLLEAGLINAEKEKWIISDDSIITIKGLTYSGHEFLNSIRDPKIWKETKNKLKGLKEIR